MTCVRLRKVLVTLGTAVVLCGLTSPARAELTAEEVLDAIESGKNFLIKAQRKDTSKQDGSWSDSPKEGHPVGVASLALLALVNSGLSPDQEPIARGLAYLRNVEEPFRTYEISLMIMVLAAAKDGKRDIALMQSLTKKLEDSQVKAGPNAGGWSYGQMKNFGQAGAADRSNSQFAVLGLREAQYAGIPVSRSTWELIRDYWTTQQGSDGGWGYQGDGGAGSTGSMTVAGISTLAIVDSILRGSDDENPDGTPICCGKSPTDEALKRGLAWLDRPEHFTVDSTGGRALYYLYGLERGGRLNGRRYFSQQDWYREGAASLIKTQVKQTGCWKGGGFEQDAVVSTSFALLFLSKGLAPVLINKLKYGPRDPNHPDRIAGGQWNLHRRDVQNLAELISGLPQWPKLLITQQVDIAVALSHGGVQDLAQAPILFINGAEAPGFSPPEIDLLREYVTQGGFIFAEAACTKTGFDRGFRDLLEKMYPQGDFKLKRLPVDHPVFRSEYLIDAETTELWGVDLGCRTAIIYSPHDLACLWDKWSPFDPPDRSPQLKASIFKATRVGVNIVAYATARSPSNKLEQQESQALRSEQKVERGFLQIAKLRHSGGWDTAPNAVRNLLTAINSYAGTAASTQEKNLAPADPSLFKFPLVYMHGRNQFQFSSQEQERLHDYLLRGGVLFADACCGAPQFDATFRELIARMFPNQKLKRIPPKHRLFTSAVGHDLPRVKRRELGSTGSKQALKMQTVEDEPFLEGIELNGRYVVIYSKYDISCALERQTSAICTGYLHDDAVKIAVNVVLYSLLQ